jgi:uncharacterized membrane protein
MSDSPEPSKLEHHIRRRLISGFLVIVPLWITFVVLKMLFHAMASLLVPILDELPFLNEVSDQFLALAAVVIFVLTIYFIGTISAFVMGRRVVAIGEQVILRIPVVKSIYSAVRQVVNTFSISEKAQFKSVVLVQYPRIGLYVIAFVTGTIMDTAGRKLYKVFIPHAPNPMSGFLQLMAEDELNATNLSVEEGIKMIISGGVISPARIEIKTNTRAVPEKAN